MKALIQRVTQAKVEVAGDVVGQINDGMLVLIGIDAHDTRASVEVLADRILKYRLFSDDQGRMNLSVQQTKGGVLLVSQFTLSANTQKGLRPGFSTAATPDVGRILFDHVVERINAQHDSVQTGQYGANMSVSLSNDGPVTFLLKN